MLPSYVVIPFILVGLFFIAWAVWQIQLTRAISHLPSPIQRYFFRGIEWLESKFDESKTEHVVREQQPSPDSSVESDLGAQKTFIKFTPRSIIDSHNVVSLTDNGSGDFTITFFKSMNPKTLVVQPIGDSPRSFRVASVSADTVRLIFEKEPSEITLRFDD